MTVKCLHCEDQAMEDLGCRHKIDSVKMTDGTIIEQEVHEFRCPECQSLRLQNVNMTEERCL